ncbi:MAG TPA: type I phosphomannose isomerase catalytic subunit [Candidatus Udaeobacter sp.]|jgi:mannose-6-phosphate isomerase|nr:type I phosphomannose isomerase catalytic subunit [Candidatus Udaeobacter sp.]
MPDPNSSFLFKPIFQERIWGGRKLADLFGKNLPPKKRIGESWEIADRPEAQSVVRDGPLRGKTLHELWMQKRQSIFGNVPDAARFPLLVKTLDARETLSLQVHPPEKVAAKLGGEPKTEFWYVAAADPGAELFVGLEEALTRAQFEEALRSRTVAEYVHRIRVKTGDAMFLPAGRLHAVGEGNLIVEIQQNSDTTYRVFDWNRVDDQGKPRQLHLDQALQCIDFNDIRPQLVETQAEVLLHDDLFEIQKWNFDSPRQIAPLGQFAIVYCLTGKLRCADVELGPGGSFLIPARLEHRSVKPLKKATSLLRITIPNQT